ncbi:MAG: thioesterase domain-containing protein [Byssovorax sp.]
MGGLRPSANGTLVTLEPGGKGPPFFCVPTWSADLHHYRLLSVHLGRDIPFHALCWPGAGGEAEPFDSIERLAAHHVTQILEVDATGPYFLGGASAGGTVAWEIARQLHDRGKRVAFLALIDAYYRGHERYLPDKRPGRGRLDALLARVDYHLGSLVTRDRRAQRDYLASLFAGRLPSLLGARRAAEPPSPAMERLREATQRALIAYVPPAYPGKATLFFASGEPIRPFRDPRFTWSALAGRGLEIHVLDGEHETVLEEPGVAAAANKLRAAILRAREESTQPASVRA